MARRSQFNPGKLLTFNSDYKPGEEFYGTSLSSSFSFFLTPNVRMICMKNCLIDVEFWK